MDLADIGCCECRVMILDALKAAGFLFVSLSEGDLEQVVMAMSERTLSVGQTIIRQGMQCLHACVPS